MTAEEAVREAVTEHLCIDEFSLDADFRTELAADSLDVVQILVILEEKIGMVMNEKELWGIHTPRELITLVQSYTGEVANETDGL